MSRLQEHPKSAAKEDPSDLALRGIQGRVQGARKRVFSQRFPSLSLGLTVHNTSVQPYPPHAYGRLLVTASDRGLEERPRLRQILQDALHLLVVGA